VFWPACLVSSQVVSRRIGRVLIGSLLQLFIATRQLGAARPTVEPGGGNWLYTFDFIR
jgi:hypothetical protein